MIVMESMGQLLPLRRRKLIKSDLVRMRLPKRYWNVDCSGVSDLVDEEAPVSPRELVKRYIHQIEDMRARGYGMLLWGPNGTGKTAIAAIIAKEYRRRFNTVLFIEAASLKSIVASKDQFDEDESYWDRAKSVDVLILDDLCKGIQDSAGFGEQVIDELIRTRNANQLVTIITTNAIPKGENETLSQFLKTSTLHSLKEHVMAIYVRGEDKRDEISREVCQGLVN